MDVLITFLKLILYTAALVFDIILIVKTFQSFERIKFIEKTIDQDHRLIKEMYRRQENLQKKIQDYIRNEENAE